MIGQLWLTVELQTEFLRFDGIGVAIVLIDIILTRDGKLPGGMVGQVVGGNQALITLIEYVHDIGPGDLAIYGYLGRKVIAAILVDPFSGSVCTSPAKAGVAGPDKSALRLIGQSAIAYRDMREEICVGGDGQRT